MNEHPVTAEHLRRLATVDKGSMFRDAGTLIDTEEGVTQVPFRVVEATLSGQTTLAHCRLLYDRRQFIEDGVVAGARPKTIDGSDLDAKLAMIAACLNDDPEEAAK